MKVGQGMIGRGIVFALVLAMAEVAAASAYAQNTRVVIDHGASESDTENVIYFYVHKTIHTENIYYAANHSHIWSRSDPHRLRDLGVLAIETRTGCAVDRESVVLTIFRSELFGIYSSRIDAAVHC